MGNTIFTNSFKKIAKALGLLITLVLSLACFAGCSVDTIREAFYGSDSGSFDSLGRERLSPVSVKLMETSTTTGSDGKTVTVTDKTTGALVWEDSPYAHSIDKTTGATVTYQFPGYKVVQDDKDLFFQPTSTLQNTVTQYSGTYYDFVGFSYMVDQFFKGRGSAITTNDSQNANNQLNTYYSLDGTTDFYIYSAETDSYTPVSKDYIEIQYRLILVDATTNNEAQWDDENNCYKTYASVNYYNSIDYRIVFNPRLSAGSENRTVRVKRMVQDGSVVYGDSHLSATCAYKASKLTFTLNSSNSTEVGFAELTYNENEYRDEKLSRRGALARDRHAHRHASPPRRAHLRRRGLGQTQACGDAPRQGALRGRRRHLLHALLHRQHDHSRLHPRRA